MSPAGVSLEARRPAATLMLLSEAEVTPPETEAGSSDPAELGPAELVAWRQKPPLQGWATADQWAIEIQKVSEHCTFARLDVVKQQAREQKEAQLGAIQQRLVALAEAAEARAKAEKAGFWSRLFRWVGAVAAALAGAAGAVFSGGASAAIAAVVVGALLTAESVTKGIADLLVDVGALSEKTARRILACLGNLEAIVQELADRGAFGRRGQLVSQIFSLVTGAAKAIVSCIFGGGSGVADLVGKICQLSATGLGLALETAALVERELPQHSKLPPALRFALDLVKLGLELGAGACSLAGQGAPAKTSARIELASLPRATQLRSTASWSRLVAAASQLGAAGLEGWSRSSLAEADRLDAVAVRERALIQRASTQLEKVRGELRELYQGLNQTRDDVQEMLRNSNRLESCLMASQRV